MRRFVHLLTFQHVTSSPQGPPNYSTHAALHSNQILTLKVCQPPHPPPPPPQPSTSWANFSSALPHRQLTFICVLAHGKNMKTCLFSSFSSGFQFQELLTCYVCFPHSSSLWTGACTVFAIFAFLISVLFFICIFPLSSVFQLFLASLSLCLLCVPLFFAPQMVFPSYNHGFISGDQSNSFQRRFLKVDHNKRHACLLTAHRHLPSSHISCQNFSHLLFHTTSVFSCVAICACLACFNEAD